MKLRVVISFVKGRHHLTLPQGGGVTYNGGGGRDCDISDNKRKTASGHM